MGKLPLCRICLVGDVRMYVVFNKNLHDLYQKLTQVPFVTQDRRPMLACFICFTKLKQFWRFQKKCLEAEEWFARMRCENHEPLRKPEDSKLYNGFTVSPIVLINIGDESKKDSVLIKEEFTDVSVRTDDRTDPEELHQTDMVPVEMPQLDARRPNSREINETKINQRVCVDRQRFKCDLCLRSYSESTGLIKHRRTHITERPFKCEICQRSFTKINGLKRHRLAHSETSFKCDICLRHFSEKTNFLRHTQSHTQKSFICDICKRNFTKKYELFRHIRNHTVKKSYKIKCDTCQRGFSKVSYLRNHIRKHTGPLALGPCSGLRPIPSPREEASVPAVGT